MEKGGISIDKSTTSSDTYLFTGPNNFGVDYVADCGEARIP
jgi:hypothetical protein